MTPYACLRLVLISALTLSGPVLAQPAEAEALSDDALLNWNGAITNRASNRHTGTICQFISGPKSHGWHDFAPFPPAPIDSTCEDGAGSVGFVQATGHGDRY